MATTSCFDSMSPVHPDLSPSDISITLYRNEQNRVYVHGICNKCQYHVNAL